MSTNEWSVYQLFNETTDLLYVGVTKDVPVRTRQHTRQQSWGSEIFHCAVVARKLARREALGLEGRLIRQLHPKYNVTHNYQDEPKKVLEPLTSKERFKRWYAEFGMKHWFSFLLYLDDIDQPIEIPLFALGSKNFTVSSWHTKDGSKSVEVRPAPSGRATIHDKDVLLYLLSQLVNSERSSQRKSGNRSIRIDVHNYLMSTKKMAGPGAHANLIITLNRLRDTRVITKTKTERTVAEIEFGIIESWVVTDADVAQVPITIEITLSDWIFQKFRQGAFFEIPYGYFQSKSPIVRRIHELAGPRFAINRSWTISLDELLKMANPNDERVSPGFPWITLYSSQILAGFRVNLDSINDVVRLRPKY